MPAPTALVAIRTGTPDATDGVPLPTVESQENSANKIPTGVALSRRVPNLSTADRTVTAADTDTDLSTTTFGASGLINVNNAGAVEVAPSFEANTDSAVIALVLYDGAGAVIGMSPPMAFTPSSTLRKSASGHYVAVPQQVDSMGASSVKPYVVSKGDATNDLSIWVLPL